MHITHVPRPLGPFHSVRQAMAAAVRVSGSSNTPERGTFIQAQLDNARIGVSDYDRVIARWLSMWEPATVLVVTDWIARAFEAGVTSGASVFDLTVYLDRVPTNEEVDALHEAGLTDSDAEYNATGCAVHVDRVAYSRDEAVATIRDQAAAAGFLVLDVEDTTDEDDAPASPAEPSTLKHALTPLAGRVSSVGLETRCGVEGTTVVFASDVDCPQCIALMAQDGGQR